MKNFFFTTLTLLLLTLLSTCDRAQKHQEGDGHDHEAPKKEMAADGHDEGHDDQGAEDDHDDHGDEGIHLTIEQIETFSGICTFTHSFIKTFFGI